MLALNSTRVRITGNTLIGNTPAGIQIDTFAFVPHNLPAARATITGNAIRDGLGPAILVTDADGGTISHNVLTGNCSGVIAADFAGDGVRDWKITSNMASGNNGDCPSLGGPETGLGIGSSAAATSTSATTAPRAMFRLALLPAGWWHRCAEFGHLRRQRSG